MKIAHLSDLHVLGDAPEPWTAYANKRFTGWANLKFRRHAVHKHEVVQALFREVARQKVDQVVITGDFSNLAFEGELLRARKMLEDELGMSPFDISVVPGNHDLYTAGSARKKRFESVFAAYMTSDLPDVSTDHASGAFPYVRLRGDVAFIGLSSATPRPPMIASGSVGRPQRDALARVLAHADVKARLPFVLMHHPLHNPPSPLRTATNGLYDAAAMRGVLGEAQRSIVLHGHLHQRVAGELGGGIRSIGATSASLLHDDLDRRAGFNVYDVTDGQLVREWAIVFDAASGTFGERAIPALAG